MSRIERTSLYSAGKGLVASKLNVRFIAVSRKHVKLEWASKPITRKEHDDLLAVYFGGRGAEELILGAEEVSSRGTSDLMKATRLAKQIEQRFGGDLPSLEKAIARSSGLLDTRSLSVLTNALIDREVLSFEEVSRILNFY